MPRIPHGVSVPGFELATALVSLAAPKVPDQTAVPLVSAQRFDYLFPSLQTDPANFLPTAEATVEALKRLGKAMSESANDQRHSAIPALYTYFGQFLDHEITFEQNSASLSQRPLAPTGIAGLMNARTPRLDLDCIYGTTRAENDLLRDGERLRVGPVTHAAQRPVGVAEGNEHDLPRLALEQGATAIIGDPRNDENLIIAQLHVAFLRAHNALIDKGLSYTEANLEMRRHFQWLVIHDFLPRVADPEIVNDLLARGENRFYRPAANDLFMPLEFSAAAYRFGHSMVRSNYRINNLFPQATLTELFRLTAGRGNLNPALGGAGFPALSEDRIIEWPDFLEGGRNRARQIDTHLALELEQLTGPGAQPLPDEARLAVRNLLRGYLLHLPTGQAVARHLEQSLGRRGLVLSPAQLRAAVGDSQAAVLEGTEFLTHTPLWYYILAERASRLHDHLGPVGSVIVAEVLIELVRQSEDSILRQPDWQPTLGKTPGQFTLRELLRLAGVASPVPLIIPGNGNTGGGGGDDLWKPAPPPNSNSNPTPQP